MAALPLPSAVAAVAKVGPMMISSPVQLILKTTTRSYKGASGQLQNWGISNRLINNHLIVLVILVVFIVDFVNHREILSVEMTGGAHPWIEVMERGKEKFILKFDDCLDNGRES